MTAFHLQKRSAVILCIVLVVLVAAVWFVACTRSGSDAGSGQPAQEKDQDIAMQQQVIEALITENADLRAIGESLRQKVVVLSENNSRLGRFADACRTQCPQVASPGAERPNPEQRTPLSDILVHSNEVVIAVPDLQEGVIAASNSMDPLLDENTVVLESTPKSPAEVNVGDIIVFQQDDQRIIHRVIDIGHDAEGWYATTKGDNNNRPDPGRIRFASVVGVVVGIVY